MLVASVGLLVVWNFHPRRSAVAADAVLIRAADTEKISSGLDAQPGVIFERIEVRVRGQRFEWPVYRDRQGKRRPRFQVSSDHEMALRDRLEVAGVAREDPLSAISFKAWSDAFSQRSDHIVSSASGLITIAASIPPGAASVIREETLTIRQQDYHPVARTVAFRDQEVVEFAELEYKVLDWSQANRDWFESAAPVRLAALRNALPAGSSTAVLSESQLILAELQVRLVLSLQDVDVNEQIDLTRQSSGIQVCGLASTPERKQQIQTALAAIPNVVSRITTPSERDATGPGSTQQKPASLRLVTTVSQPSPLFLYWRNLHHTPEEVAQTSALLLNSGLRISQQSRAMHELAQEFAAEDALDGSSRPVFYTLLGDHEDKLRAALADQARLLRQLAPSHPAPAHTLPSAEPATPDSSQGNRFLSLERLAARSLELCRELTSGENSEQREAASILADLAAESAALSADLDHVSASRN
jgi:hypothetical protein